MPLTPAERKRLQGQRDREDPDRQNRKGDTWFMFGEVAVIRDDHENIWFRAVDIARALEMEEPNVGVCHTIDKKYCQTYEELGCSLMKYRDIPEMQPKTTFVNETGMNGFVIRSRKTKAEAFAEWVYGVVLPSIRKTHKYEMEPADNPYKEMNDWLKLQLEELKKENANLNATNMKMTTQFAQDLNKCVSTLFSMKPSCVPPPLQDQGKWEYFVLYRKGEGENTEAVPYDMLHYICRVQQNSIDKRCHELSHEYKNGHKLLEGRVPNSVMFFNDIMEQMSQFVERSGPSIKGINETTESPLLTMIQNGYRTTHGGENHLTHDASKEACPPEMSFQR